MAFANITHDAPFAGDRLRSGIAARMSTAAGGFRRWRSYRNTLAELSALSDRELDDLGLSHASVDAAARKAAGWR